MVYCAPLPRRRRRSLGGSGYQHCCTSAAPPRRTRSNNKRNILPTKLRIEARILRQTIIESYFKTAGGVRLRNYCFFGGAVFVLKLLHRFKAAQVKGEFLRVLSDSSLRNWESIMRMLCNHTYEFDLKPKQKVTCLSSCFGPPNFVLFFSFRPNPKGTTPTNNFPL